MSIQKASTKQISINIGGMGCAGCANTILDAIEDLDGVSEATVDLESDTTSVTYNPDAVTPGDFKQAVEEAGYSFEGTK